MTQGKPGIAVKTATLVENHSFLASLLAVLCLLFAINFYLTGPGSDGGSGLGGTGKFGGTGESGLGGTGMSPDPGTAFKLGAIDNEDQEYTDDLESVFDAIDTSFNKIASDETLEDSASSQLAGESLIFAIDSFQLSPESLPVLAFENVRENARENARDSQLATEVLNPDSELENVALVTNSDLELDTTEISKLTSESLISSLDILNSLMLAEAETSLQLAANSSLETINNTSQVIDTAIRNRIAVPVRPERPDRFTIPARIAPVQRVNVPAPPPVRPMRTFSTLLNR